MARRNQPAEEVQFVMLPLYVIQHANAKLSGSQLQFLIWVQAYSRSAACLSKGYTASEWTVEKFTVPRLMKMLGMESDRGVQIMIRDLIDRGLIRRIPEEESDSPRQGYQYKLTSAVEWDAAPDYKPKPSSKPAEDDDAKTEDSSSAAKAPGRSVPPRGKIEIRFSQPIQQIDYRNEVNLPLEVFAESKANGSTELRVSVPDEINKRLEFLQLNFSDGGTAVPPQALKRSSEGGNAVPRTTVANSTVSPSDPRTAVPPSSGLLMPFAELRDMCDREVKARRIKGVLSDDVWVQVVEALGDTPEKFALACFEADLREKYQRNYPVKTLLLKHLAEDARNEWLKDPVVEPAEPVITPEQARNLHIRALAGALGDVEADRAHGVNPHPDFIAMIESATPEELAAARRLSGELARIS